MSVPPIIQYPLDLTGESPTNKIVGEVRLIASNNERAFVPSAGPFYTESMVIRNAETGEPLTPVDDYILVQPFQQASLRSGKDVQSAVVIKVEAPIEVSFDYQVVGGEYSWNLTGLIELVEELNLDERPVKWGSIIGKPTGYPPAPHIHDIGDTYGWEYVVWQLERISQAILIGDEASHDEIRAQILAIRTAVENDIAQVAADHDEHVNNTDNPHQVTKAQVGLGNVDNFITASDAEALAGVRLDRFMTPAGVALLSERLADVAVSEHVADKTNPHGVTKAQVGLGNVDNFATASESQGISQTVNDKFMTPQRTYEAIMVHAGNLITAHTTNFNNPHQVTKAQVGLGSVQNLPLASTVEAVEGSSNARYMTPVRVKEAIDAIAGNLLNNHISNINNPHQVTKAQVGLSDLPNAITRARDLNSDNALLTAGGMYDHIAGGDHDARYVRIGAPNNASLRTVGETLQGYINGQWRQLWPATWGGFVAPGANDNEAGNGEEIELLVAGGRLFASVGGNFQQIWPAAWS
jgi:hypothetical protein